MSDSTSGSQSSSQSSSQSTSTLSAGLRRLEEAEREVATSAAAEGEQTAEVVVQSDPKVQAAGAAVQLVRNVYISASGNHYLASKPRDPADSQLPFYSPSIIGTLVTDIEEGLMHTVETVEGAIGAAINHSFTSVIQSPSTSAAEAAHTEISQQNTKAAEEQQETSSGGEQQTASIETGEDETSTSTSSLSTSTDPSTEPPASRGRSSTKK